jgi:hypothetical protein
MIGHPLADQTAIIKDPFAMGQFMTWLEHHDRVSCSTPLTNTTTDETTDIESTPLTIPKINPDYQLDCGIPLLRHSSASKADISSINK